MLFKRIQESVCFRGRKAIEQAVNAAKLCSKGDPYEGNPYIHKENRELWDYVFYDTLKMFKQWHMISFIKACAVEAEPAFKSHSVRNAEDGQNNNPVFISHEMVRGKTVKRGGIVHVV